ncbi:SPRY domain-containing protein [Acidovorax cavernicola]|uniref:B30.2/SPRY domain-containing protein n=1 Tax=Acidovorax cavernicola TaxID=1675792 RepID=A0A9X8D4G5_9BURK|nr:SPRY domain-containing protein [Acidovorax cavernicola]RIX79113.1 hypothetical protein D3H34_15345 [Acidovorax cavernicola]
MAAHRYWRALGFEAYGLVGLEFSEFHLLSGTTRVDASATLTSNIAPTSGALVNLQDDDLSTGALWSASAVSALVMTWDAGVGGSMDVSDIRFGSGNDAVKFPLAARLQFSDDASTWTDLLLLAGFTWPGPRAKTDSVDATNVWSFVDRARTWSTLSADQLVLGTANATSGKGLVYKSTGKLQFEVTVTSIAPSADFAVGVGTAAANPSTYVGSGAGSYGYNRNGNKYLAGAATPYGTGFVAGDVIGVVIDFAVGSLTFYRNGVSQGVASATGLLGLTLVPYVGTTSGVQVMSTATLKGSGFTYPVAGASDWSEAPLIRRHNIMRGRAALAGDIVSINTLASIAKPLSAMVLDHLGKSRREYNYTDSWALGVGRINGTVKEDGSPDVPVRRLVRLIREQDGTVIREQWSDRVTGAYQFDYVDERKRYTVISYDYEHDHRAVVGDNLAPDLIETPVIPVPELALRGASPLQEISTATTIALTVPNTTQVGDLLVAIVSVRSSAAATPAGWTLRSSSGGATGSGATTEVHVYTKTAVAGDGSTTTSYTFGQTSNLRLQGQMLALSSPTGTPAFATEGHLVKNSTSDAFVAVPAVSSAISKNQIAIAAATFAGYIGQGKIYSLGWNEIARPVSASNDNRLAVAWRLLSVSEVTTGFATTDAVTPGNAMTSSVLIFTDP